MRVTTLYASSAGATAAYYTRYLTAAPGEIPGRWVGTQAGLLGLGGEVSTDQLELLLSGRDPVSGVTLGRSLADRRTANGTLIRAVAGFDATLSAPKSLSVWWALTGDPGLAEAHDTAVRAVVEYVERVGATTRVRSKGSRLHPDSQGLIAAAFRQTTSRLDDPQLHTHVVISAKVQTDDGRWLALDARVLKQHQRAFGGLYQSVLRAELTHRYGVAFGEIVSGQAEIAGVPPELLEVFSKRAAQVDTAVAAEIDVFRHREGRSPTRFERAALERQVAADTRPHKTGHGVPDLRTRWSTEAATTGITADTLTETIELAARTVVPVQEPTVQEVIADLSAARSAWHRMDIVRAVTDRLTPRLGFDGERWVGSIDRCVDRVLEHCVDLDPVNPMTVRGSDGRSIWIEPIAAHVTSDLVLAQEEQILTWALDTQLDQPEPSTTIHRGRLDVLQFDAAAAVAGHDRLTVVVGPAGAGKTSMLAAAVADLHTHHRPVLGLAPTAKAARVLDRDTGVVTDTVAKLLHDWSRPNGPRPEWRFHPGATLIIDEAGMLSTPNLHQLIGLADRQQWRLALIGDPRQLQAVGRGGLFTELVTTTRHIELQRIHRFTNPWEATASLQLRHGQPAGLDAYLVHGRVRAGSIDEHLDTIITSWLERQARGETVAITTTTNDHVNLINHTIQTARLHCGQLDPDRFTQAADGPVHVGDVIATRRNDRHLHTTNGETIRNRQQWTINDINLNGDLTVTQSDGHDTAILPAGYVREHVRLGYAATEPGNQSDTNTASITLAIPAATTGRGLYVGITRGHDDNIVLVVTDTNDLGEARDTLQRILTTDRADTPAVTQRRNLAEQARHQPRLQPRCAIPSWIADLHVDAVTRRDQLGAELDRTEQQRERMTDDVFERRDRYETANLACAPFDTELRSGLQAVRNADDQLRTARRTLETAAPLRRRRPRHQLSVATEQHGNAFQQLAEIETRSRPFTSERDNAADALNESARALRSYQQLNTWEHLPERYAYATSLVDGLDTWRRWATGQPIDTETFVACINNLETDHHNRTATALADVLREWAGHHNIQLEPVRTAQQDRSFGVEL